MKRFLVNIYLVIVLYGCNKEKNIENRIIGRWKSETGHCYFFKNNGYLDQCYSYDQISWELSDDNEFIYIDESLIYDFEPYFMKITKCTRRKLWLKGIRDGEELELKLSPF